MNTIRCSLAAICVICLLLSMVSFAMAATASSTSKTGWVNKQKKNGTASVWCGIPCVGHGYIKTPWQAKYDYNSSTKQYRNVKVSTETSYQVGLCIGSYTHRKSYAEYSSTKKSFKVYAVGTISYGIALKLVTAGIQTGPQTFVSYHSL